MDSYNINQMENREELQNPSHRIGSLVGGVRIGQSYLDEVVSRYISYFFLDQCEKRDH